ncbi:hypothetical protein RUE5091_03817 [Ruegeria denitrificans]|uniref:Uncharacterized protein n=1 Tax=Ruegeria denitrificans TaxID=1715692 RepID=A0A0P1IP49_9RHOB|nr:hypothetical protein [Ruegeria denitrificans]CUK14942.1 hypothetical protein RUE5091_03817 [Ruegeria denitrificans]
MTNGRKDILERLKPIWEAVGELAENNPELNVKAYLDDIWGEEGRTHTASLGVENSPARRDEKVAEDPEAQFKMIAVAYATGDMDEVDRVINYLAFIRRMKKQGIYEFGHWSDEDSDER